VSRTETETQPQTAVTPGHAPDIGESPNGVDPARLPPDIERIDLSDPEYREHAFERYEEMRARCPVSRAIITSGEESDGNRGFFNRPLWLVTDYEEGSRALLDRAMTVEITSVLTPEQLAQMPETPEVFQPLRRNILTVDPPEHTRLRKLVQPSFTASAIEKLRPRIQQIADELLDAVEAAAADCGPASSRSRMSCSMLSKQRPPNAARAHPTGKWN
jgi:cytochrome P450